MRKSIWLVVLFLLISTLALAACSGGSSSGGNTSPGTIVKNRQSVPAAYAGMKNPFAGNQDALTAGKEVFSNNCVTCHGTSGRGDGPSASALDPKPADLTYTAKETSVEYVHWVASEGGKAAGLDATMPSFKGVLTDDQIWQVANYIMNLK